MPRGPKGEKRPADVNARAVMIARIATGEVDDAPENDGKDPAAKALGKKGGTARAAKMSPERRAEIAKKAAAKRWVADPPTTLFLAQFRLHDVSFLGKPPDSL
jgi:hypothetical protein